MTLVKGPNGLVVDVAPSVASGLIGGGHVVAVDTKVDDSEATSDDSAEGNDDHDADQEEDTDTEVDDSTDDSDETSNVPSGNASRGEWEAYALAQGFAEEQLDGLKRDEIRALFDE